MQIYLVLKLLVLLAAANGAPIFAKRLLGRTLDRALDSGTQLADGRYLFGPTKTIRGIICSLAATTALAPLVGLPAYVGAAMAGAAMVGDLFSSFAKRRLGVAPSRMFFGLDQLQESLLPSLVVALLLPLTVVDIATIVGGFVLGEVVTSRILFHLGIRDQPI